jgi:ABC-type tungstate transport system substrate-binding protein
VAIGRHHKLAARLGAALAICHFRRRAVVVVILNALIGRPPAVVGLIRLRAAVAIRIAGRP